ncbi:integrin alpha-6 isoform X1 [Oncorhynchus tshawytscha]|uniref:Integrin alpha-2 domain-containing protein n=1 Tax=Oncorhynchus tshawytscha TaxID=74940 RepID=A0A8C8FLU3_ONCTS|nr:integrin alpha-6 isoform X1 [Oncorhynchus tshawytscha]
MVLPIRYFPIHVALFCLLEWTPISAFNLDTLNVLRKDGEPGSLFGFSLAMHRQLIPSDKRILLIGAPRAKALANQRANITGGLYSCDITTESDDCDRIDFDNEEDVRVENKENQWMGVTVNSQGPGGKIVTCAHRYQRRLFVDTAQESRDITGRCYVLSQDLTIDTSSDEDGGNWKFCEGRARGHERFGSCQQGLAATFTKDYHYVVFGAPGAYNWKGIVRVEQKNNTLLEKGFYDDGPYEVGDENRLDPDLVPVPANSYLGFSLDSGFSITKGHGLTIVSGAPRANHCGAVVLLRKENEASARLSPEYILEGPGLASSFGYDVAVVDLNGDGWQDIVVGAPQFFMKEGDIGGAVYVYINQAGKWAKITPIRLNGTKDSMFGLAVENIGDINQDSYQDIAVGAPYADTGAGKVYIYHGSANGINTMPAQILEGKTNNIRLFGYSLAGNMDLDKNSYPDIAIGSLSDTVLVYRARPIISIKKDVKITPKEIDFTKKTCGNSICLTVEACFTYKANPASYSPKLTIRYAFEAEADRRKQGLISRVLFLNKSRTDQDFQSTGFLDLRGQNKRACTKTKIRLQDNIRDKLRGIPIEVSVGIQGTKRQKRQNALPQLVPILDNSQPSKVVTEVNFLKEGCGNDNICQSNLQLEYRFCSKEPNQEVFHPLQMQNGLPVISLSDQKDIALEVTVKNRNGDDAHEAKLVGMFPNALSFSGFRSQKTTRDKPVLCLANQNGSQTECELGNPFKRDSEVTFYIILSTAGISLNTTEIDIDLELQTTSTQERTGSLKARAKVVIEMLLSVAGVARPSQVYFGGDVQGESAIKTEEEIGSLIDYEFRIINLGKPLKSFGTASLNIQWPKENVDGKWLLYLVKISTTGLEEIPCSPETEINSLKHIQESSTSRKKREAGGKTSGGKISLVSDQRKHKILMCGNGYDSRCVVIKCPLLGLDSSAVISLRSRLWNATFLENYASLNYLDIIVKASISLDAPAKNMVLRNAETQVRVTVFPEKAVAQFGGVPWWIILVAVLAGILMLALLVFLLWKCGFFKRSKHDDSVPRYHAVRIKKEACQFKDGKAKLDSFEKKQWMTSWNENESYS